MWNDACHSIPLCQMFHQFPWTELIHPHIPEETWSSSLALRWSPPTQNICHTIKLAHCKKSWIDLTWIMLLEFQCCNLYTNNALLDLLLYYTEYKMNWISMQCAILFIASWCHLFAIFTWWHHWLAKGFVGTQATIFMYLLLSSLCFEGKRSDICTYVTERIMGFVSDQKSGGGSCKAVRWH